MQSALDIITKMVTVSRSLTGISRLALVLLVLAGPAWSQYCSRRPGGCCPGRDDACTATMGSTLCYCDEFCLRSNNPDCCPDAANNCRALLTPDTPISPAPLTGMSTRYLLKRRRVFLNLSYISSHYIPLLATESLDSVDNFKEIT